jgi:hypothetical protein
MILLSRLLCFAVDLTAMPGSNITTETTWNHFSHGSLVLNHESLERNDPAPSRGRESM